MSKWTQILKKLPDPARTYIGRNELNQVDCIIPDLPGIARGKAVPAAKFIKQKEFFLPETIFFQTVTGAWVETENDKIWEEKDMTLIPDYSTATAAPWTADCILQVIHDAYDRSGKLTPFSPRNVLKRVVNLYRKKGLEPIIAPEMEFFLVAQNTDPTKPIEAMMGRSGRPAAAKQAYSMMAVDEFGPVIDDIYDFAEAQGFEIDGITQEGGAGQLEVNLRHGDPILLADQVFFFKRLIREAALRHNCVATFMAKPIENEPGSAMHIHHSIIDRQTKQNAFSGPQGGETDLFYNFIAGLQKYFPSAVALVAPYVNSYRRYVKDHAAPINLEWARDNRKAGIRIPMAKPNQKRIENRLAGMDCNPYLGIAASLACGYLGIAGELRPTKQLKGDAYSVGNSIPRVIGDALKTFRDASDLHTILGEEFTQLYLLVKQTEYSDFLKVISPWEREHLLLNV